MRWRYHGKTEQWPVDDEAQGWRLKRWLEGHNNLIAPDDERLVYGSWDPAARSRDDRAPITFGGWWTRLNEARSCRQATKDDDDDLLRRHLSDWWDRPLVAIDRARLDGFVATIRVQPKTKADAALGTSTYAPTYIRNLLRLVRRIFRTAQAAGEIPADPFSENPQVNQAALNLSKAAGIKGRRIRSDEALLIDPSDLHKLIAAAGVVDPSGALEVMLWLLIETGCRVGEALALRVGHCHLDAPVPYVRIEFTRLASGEDGPPKTGKERTTVLGPQSAAGIRRLAEGRDGAACVFAAPRRRDRGWRYHNWYEKRWAPLIAEARERHGLDRSIRLHPHALRMNHATWARDRGADPLMLAESMGHDSLLTTKGYTLDSAKARMHMASVVAKFLPTEG